MTEYRAAIIFTVVLTGLFYAVGMALFNERPAPQENVDVFFSAIENPKAGRYFFNFAALEGRTILIRAESSHGTKQNCYKITNSTFVRTDECATPISIILDRHAMGSLLAADYSPKGTLFSEFLSGHVKIEGLTLDDARKLL